MHAYIISSLKNQMPAILGKESKKKELISNLQRTYDQISKEHCISIGDFPKIDRMQEVLQDCDFKTFSVLKTKLIEDVDSMLANDVAKLMQMIPKVECSLSLERSCDWLGFLFPVSRSSRTKLASLSIA